MPSYNFIQLVNELQSLEYDVRSPLLKVFNCKHFVLIMSAVPVIMDMIAETPGNVCTAVGNGFSVEYHQHPFQVRQAITLPAPVQTKSPPVAFYQPRYDDLLSKLTWAIRLKIPA